MLERALQRLVLAQIVLALGFVANQPLMAYQRESRPRRLPDQAPFAANVAYCMRADQLFDALSVALGTNFDPPRQDLNGRAAVFRGGPRQQFAQQFGYDPSVRRDEITSTIPQTLLMMNSPVLAPRLSARQSSGVLARLLASGHEDEAISVELYLRCLAREPTGAELTVCLDYVKTATGRGEAFEDIFWSLVNSEEFLYRN